MKTGDSTPGGELQEQTLGVCTERSGGPCSGPCTHLGVMWETTLERGKCLESQPKGCDLNSVVRQREAIIQGF